MDLLICQGELYKRQTKYQIGYLYLKEAYKFSKILRQSHVKFIRINI